MLNSKNKSNKKGKDGKKASREISWARKYRPKTMNDYIGNDRVKYKLSQALKVNKLPQAILFQGNRGTGKTTFARLLTKSLMCENPKDGVACDECRTCQLLDDKFITTGGAIKDLSIEEYDIGEAGRIDNAREIVGRMKQTALNRRKQVYILDEIQKASPDAQQVFLKQLEEPNPNVYVILCTTDPQDLIPAIKSRLTVFNIKTPKTSEIVGRLAYICKEEGVDYSKEGLTLLTNKMGRNPRESINQAEFIATSEPIILDSVQKSLLIVTEDIYLDYLNTIKNGKLYEVLDLATKLTNEDGADLDLNINSFARGLGDFIVTLINLGANIRLDEYEKKTAQKLKKFGKEFTNEQLVGMLKVIKEYSNINNSGEYLLYTLTSELFDIFNLGNRDEMNINDNLARKRYVQVTNNMNNTVDVIKEDVIEVDNVGKIFRGASEVIGTGAKINQETGKINKSNEEVSDLNSARDIFGG